MIVHAPKTTNVNGKDRIALLTLRWCHLRYPLVLGFWSTFLRGVIFRRVNVVFNNPVKKPVKKPVKNPVILSALLLAHTTLFI